MTEFRTRAPGSGGGDGGGDSSSIDGHIERVIENIKNDPEIKMKVAQAAQENGVDPMILKAVFPELGKTAESQTPQVEQAPEQTKPETQVKTVTEKPDAQELIGLIDELGDLLPQGKDTTLEELKELGEDNPDIVQTAIDMRL